MDIKKLRTLIKENKLNKFYKCKAWREIRKKALERDNNECQKCKEQRRFSIAECVHHKQEVKQHPELALELSNLMCLCNQCHNLIHEKQGKLNKNSKKKFFNEERW